MLSYVNLIAVLFCNQLSHCTLIENHRKSQFQNCERSELRLHFERTKVYLKGQKWSILVSLWKPEISGQIVLPNRPTLIGQKLAGKAKIENIKYDISSDFQTLCICEKR